MAAGLAHGGREASTPRVGDVARRAVATCRPGETIEAVRKRAREGGWEASVVVDDERVVLGVVSTEDAAVGEPATLTEDVMDPAPITFRPNLGVEELPDYARQPPTGPVLVTTLDGVLVGLLARSS
jgi:Mg/Co/Ni transporter MgtE